MLDTQWLHLAEPAALWSLIAAPFILLSAYLILRQSNHFRPGFLALTSLAIACVCGAISLAEPVFVQKFSSLQWLPRSFVTVLDDSGSMSTCFDKTLLDNETNPSFEGRRNCDEKTAFHVTRAQVLDFVSNRMGDKFAVTLLNDQALVLTTLNDSTSTTLKLLSTVSPAFGGTYIKLSLLSALNQLQSVPEASRVLVVVSDAEDVIRGGDSEEIRKAIAETNARIYWVHTRQESRYYPGLEIDFIKLMEEVGATVFNVKNDVESAEAFAKISAKETGRLTHMSTTIMADNVIKYFAWGAFGFLVLSLVLAVFGAIASNRKK